VFKSPCSQLSWSFVATADCRGGRGGDRSRLPNSGPPGAAAFALEQWLVLGPITQSALTLAVAFKSLRARVGRSNDNATMSDLDFS